MNKHVFRAGLIVVLFMLVTSGAMLVKAQTDATAGMDELCGLNPGLHAAITDTLASYPPSGYEDTETYLSLMYFWGAVIKDAEWCTTGRRAGIDPDLTERTLRWHYGNASEFMRQYTAMVQSGVPAATPVPTPEPTPNLFTGTGTRTERVNLDSGLWIAHIAVTENEECFASVCIPGNFIVQMESVNDGSQALLVNELAKEWEGSVTVRVGDGILELSPGPQIMSVDAEGSWSIRFEKE